MTSQASQAIRLGQSDESLYFQVPTAPPYEGLIMREMSSVWRIQDISIMQLIKGICSQNSEALQEQSTIALRKVFVIKVLMAYFIVLGFIAGGTCLTLFPLVTPKNSTNVSPPILGGLATGIIILVTMLANFYLIDKGKKEMQLAQISTEFDRMDSKKFTAFVTAELSEFQGLHQKIYASIETNPRKFLEILYSICQLFTKWKEIQQSEEPLRNYNSMSITKGLTEEVQEDLQHLVEKNPSKKQSHIESLRKQILQEKEILKKLLS